MCPLKKDRWSPYAVGFLIGILFLVSYFIFNKTIGTSTTFVKFAALIQLIFDQNIFSSTPYYLDYLKNSAWIDWQMSLVIGIFLGATFSYRMIKNKNSYSPLNLKQKIMAFIGGIFVIIGARFAGGCTSGHAISGGIQLATSGYLFMIGVFALGIPTALLSKKIFGKDYL